MALGIVWLTDERKAELRASEIVCESCDCVGIDAAGLLGMFFCEECAREHEADAWSNDPVPEGDWD